MTPSSAASSSRSPLGHVLRPDWKQELNETQFARALLHAAAQVADRVAEERTCDSPTIPISKKGGTP